MRSGSGNHLLGDDHELPPSPEKLVRLPKSVVPTERKPDLARRAGRECRCEGLDEREIKSAGELVGKSEENWANFSVKMSGKKGSATVHCQAFRQGDSWRFTVVSLDSAGKRVYLCKWIVFLKHSTKRKIPRSD